MTKHSRNTDASHTREREDLYIEIPAIDIARSADFYKIPPEG